MLASGIPSAAVADSPPFNQAIAFHPEDPDLIAIYAFEGGLLLSNDGGESFRFVCEDFIKRVPRYIPTLRYTSAGDILYAHSFNGLRKVSSDGCSWEHPSETLADGVNVARISEDPSDFAASYVVTTSGAEENAIYHSTDEGQTWQALETFPVGDFLKQLYVVPDDPQHRYLVLARYDMAANAAVWHLAHSTDGGATWTEQASFLEGEENQFEILHVSTEDPNHLLVAARTDPFADDASAFTDRVLRSTDGGMTWTKVMDLGAASAVAFRDDTLWLGDSEAGGLWRSDDQGASFMSVQDDLRVGCLAYAHDKLWVCAFHYLNGFSLAYSTDGARTLTPVLCDDVVAGIAQCGDESEIGPACTAKWEDWRGDLEFGMPESMCAATGAGGTGGDSAGSGSGTAGDASAGSGTAGTARIGNGGMATAGSAGSMAGAGGAAGPSAEEGSGCSCRVTDWRSAETKGLGLVALGLLAVLRGRRHRHTTTWHRRR